MFTIYPAEYYGSAFSVDYATADDTAKAGTDYTSVSGTLTFSAGSGWSHTVTVPIVDDTIPEPTESFRLVLSNPTVPVPVASGGATILDDDPDPHLWVNDIFVNESDGWVNFTLSLSGPSEKTVRVRVATADGTANPDDYMPTDWGQITFQPGQTTKTVPVWIRNDTIPESTEYFTINLWEAQNAVITDAQGVGTIYDDDPPPTDAGPYKPDGRIRKGSGAFIGNNVYNSTGAGQSRTGSAAKGKAITFDISIQNDGTSADRFKVKATGTAASTYTVKYFHGTTDITAAVVAGTYKTLSLAPGATYLITAKVTVKSTAATGSKVARLVTLTSVGNSTRKDAVKFTSERL